METRDPYTVECDRGGCEICGSGATWTVVGPDGYALGQSFEDKEVAEDLAGYMNGAHEYALTITAAK